ncbi:hypothetical protein I5563_15695 [Acinetobacter baumannii]|nr:hypothetical protein [Acinetobacter baumannii]MBJ9465888.1 hypothetical protein [Acinetobacter baumannii]
MGVQNNSSKYCWIGRVFDLIYYSPKLLNLTDFSILPGLNILRESRELVQQLVDQFEIKGLRVQSGRLEVQVGIAN